MRDRYVTVRELTGQLAAQDPNAVVLLIVREGPEGSRAGWLDVVSPDRQSGTVDLIANGTP